MHCRPNTLETFLEVAFRGITDKEPKWAMITADPHNRKMAKLCSGSAEVCPRDMNKGRPEPIRRG